MFRLRNIIAPNATSDIEDTAKLKFSLTALGYYDDSETGLSPYPEKRFFNSIMAFQKDNDLKIDGVVKPKGETHTKIKSELKRKHEAKSAFDAFARNYVDMREADTIGADRYFHCRANYEATEKGWDGFAASVWMSDAREVYGITKDTIKQGLSEALKDNAEDQKANRYGRNAARSGRFPSAREACSIFRPKALDEKY